MLSAIRSGRPVCCMPGSVIRRMRFAPYWERSKPISSAAPAPNFRGGAPQVKTLSSVGTSGPALIATRLPSRRLLRTARHSRVVRALRSELELLDLLGVVAEDDGGVGPLGDAADLLHRCVELAHVVDDGGGCGGRAVALAHVHGVRREDHRPGV